MNSKSNCGGICFLTNLLIPLALGFLISFVTRDSMNIYEQINIPAGAPPSWLFGVVWTILYALMGISSYLIYSSDSPYRREALVIYAIQLAVNLIWPIIFFNLDAYFVAFIWIIVLWVMIIVMIMAFWKVRPLAAILQIPYLLWVTFAAWLNFMIFRLN